MVFYTLYKEIILEALQKEQHIVYRATKTVAYLPTRPALSYKIKQYLPLLYITRGLIFRAPVPSYKYRFQISYCLHCLYRRPLVVNILPPIISPSILAINRGRELEQAQFLHNSYYDSRVFESTLKVVFDRKESLFRPFVTSSGPLFSRAKFGVIATSISRNTYAFIIGNFNTVQGTGDTYGYKVLRPDKVKDKPMT
ncbi:patatin-like phospholipase [Penicillium cf. viridicatum]|uniref:Patatin-like phospholipase n=1 Tax=Penicillium cf. viridicatum TaxID=2972119 RepID=A0A9W9JAD7_9EURO|nr:patatin-like phospholipase [Penicillium cf. viridicatum]